MQGQLHKGQENWQVGEENGKELMMMIGFLTSAGQPDVHGTTLGRKAVRLPVHA